ncbi:MAG TPA: GNAT family N-acetyltransferase [Chloroflexia bacterium]|nr:GNAT family N-acetyltransferase [Chloroflexia bacterium]
MEIELIANNRLKEFLQRTGPAGVFARYVAQLKPQEKSLAVLADAQVLGTALCGRDFDLYEAFPHWVFTSSPEAAQLLAQALPQTLAMNYPLQFKSIFQRAFPLRTHSVDRIYTLTIFNGICIPEEYPQVRLLTGKELSRLLIAPEIRHLLGNFSDWTEEKPLYGIQSADELVAIAEAQVQDDQYGAIQQLYTVESWRGKGLAKKLVGKICHDLLVKGKKPLYQVSEDNPASLKVTESLGFVLESRWGFME